MKNKTLDSSPLKLVAEVFNIKNTSPYPMLSKSLDNPLDKNRIFFIEDSRLKICNFESDTLNCFKIISWNGNIPKVMIQFTYIIFLSFLHFYAFLYL